MFDQRFGPDDIEIVDSERAFDGYFKVDVHRFRHRLFAGGWSDVIRREVFERGHAVAVLPWDPASDRVLLIRQFRFPAQLAGLPPWQIETVAGIIDPGETAETVAERESVEEAGIRITALRRLLTFMASAGGSSESVVLYVGRADLANAGGLHGLAAEGEDIAAATLPFEDAYALIEDGAVNNTPAIMALQWLKLNREALRADWSA
jgi:ADP-ribose pyrophosphatase